MNVDQRELMLEVIEQSIAEERKDEKIASLEKHDGIWMKGESETEPEVAVEKVLKLTQINRVITLYPTTTDAVTNFPPQKAAS